MKQIGLCQNCGRSLYVNDIDLCKRCHQEVGVEILQKLDYVEPEEEEGPDMAALGLDEGPGPEEEPQKVEKEGGEEKPDPAEEPQKVEKQK